jgi:hypothetical protein
VFIVHVSYPLGIEQRGGLRSTSQKVHRVRNVMTTATAMARYWLAFSLVVEISAVSAWIRLGSRFALRIAYRSAAW